MGNAITITLKNINGSTVEATINPEATLVSDLFGIVAKRVGCSIDMLTSSYRAYFNGKQMANYRRVSEYAKEDSRIIFAPIIAGGGKRAKTFDDEEHNVQRITKQERLLVVKSRVEELMVKEVPETSTYMAIAKALMSEPVSVNDLLANADLKKLEDMMVGPMDRNTQRFYKKLATLFVGDKMCEIDKQMELLRDTKACIEHAWEYRMITLFMTDGGKMCIDKLREGVRSFKQLKAASSKQASEALAGAMAVLNDPVGIQQLMASPQVQMYLASAGISPASNVNQ